MKQKKISPRQLPLLLHGRSPTSPLHLQHCHTFRLCTPCQAQELITIVRTAFWAAYALQVQIEGQYGRAVDEDVTLS
jgi:hypothetical protein